MTATGTTTATTMTQVYTPESSEEVLASPPVVETDEETMFNPARVPPCDRRVLRLFDWVWEVVVCCWAFVLADPVAVTDPETMLSIDTAP